MNDGNHFAAVLCCRVVPVIHDEVFAITDRQVATRHVFSAAVGLEQYTTRLAWVDAFGVRQDLTLQLLTDAHAYLDETIKLAPKEPPKRLVLPRSLQLLQRPPHRSRAGLSVGSSFFVKRAAPV